MTRRSPLVLALLVLGAVACAPVATAAPAAKFKPARALFEGYVTLSNRFDPAVADLFADSALIRNTRGYPGGGEPKVLELPAAQYRQLIVAAMPLARAKDDRYNYSKVKYAAEGPNVRITAVRSRP